VGGRCDPAGIAGRLKQPGPDSSPPSIKPSEKPRSLRCRNQDLRLPRDESHVYLSLFPMASSLQWPSSLVASLVPPSALPCPDLFPIGTRRPVPFKIVLSSAVVGEPWSDLARQKLNPCATEFLRIRPTKLLGITGERGFGREQEIVVGPPWNLACEAIRPKRTGQVGSQGPLYRVHGITVWI
jgi:hypothetical protein